jgi:tRNA threonylcarbamoyladenosine biosynthesis protein TsaB
MGAMSQAAANLTLAIDTAAARCGLALWRGPAESGEAVGEAGATMARGHAEALFPMLGDLLARHALAPRHIGRIAVVTGPGSFSGIRVGLAAARGLALALGVPAVGISMFEWIAAGQAPDAAGSDGMAVAIDARRGEIYLQWFDAEGRASGAPVATRPEAAAAAMPEGALAAAGSGAELLSAAARAAGRTLRALSPAPPPAMLLARLGAARVPQTQPPVPLYIRPPDAKPQGAAIARRREPAATGA